MNLRRWASLLLAVAASVGLPGRRADAAYTRLDPGRHAFNFPPIQAQAAATAATADTAAPADAWLVESIIPLGRAEDGDHIELVTFLVPRSSLAGQGPASTRAGPYADQETHTRVLYIVKSPLGLEFILMPHTWGIRSAGERWYHSLYPGQADWAGWWAGNKEGARVAGVGAVKAAQGIGDAALLATDIAGIGGAALGGDVASHDPRSKTLQALLDSGVDPDQLRGDIAWGTIKTVGTFGMEPLFRAQGQAFGEASVTGVLPIILIP